MTELYQLQKEIYDNKVRRGFNTEDVGKEIIHLVEELRELANAYKNSDKKHAREISNKDLMVDAVGDMMVFCLGLYEMFGVDGEKVLEEIVENNKTRTYTGHI